MKTRFLDRVLVVSLLMTLGGSALAADDNRAIGWFDQTGLHDRFKTVSIYVTLAGSEAEGLPALPSGTETRFYSKVWDGLYLQVLTETGEDKVEGYLFNLSKDEGNSEPLADLEADKEDTLREIDASDFRSDDNFEPSPVHGGPATPEDPGPFRVIHYPGFDMEIRVLEFKIGNAALEKKPYFKSLSLLVTVKEKESKKKSK